MGNQQFEPERAVEVIAPQYGSAYRIGDSLVLTAAHLVAEVGSDCLVRAKQHFGEAKAKVVWKAEQADIALVELPKSIEPCEAVVFGRLPKAKAGERLEFQMYCWPAWARTKREQGRSAAGGRQIEGWIYLADMSPDSLLVIEAERLPPEGLLGSGSEWEGASGAAVVCNGLVIAVQTQHQNPRRSASLEATPLWTIYNDKQWCDLLKQHGINPEPALAAEIPPLNESIPANLPHTGVVEFVGRAESMMQLHQMLQQGARIAVSAIAGMGGIGKTELALQYALAYKQTYAGGLCWLQARSGDVGTQLVRFGQSYLNLNPPDGMELADQVKYCWRNWQAGEVLLVFDDVTDYKALNEAYLPPSTEPRFKVLMTTRLQLGRSVNQLQLDVLDETAALVLLESLVGGNRIESQLDDAKRLCEQLGYLPLGLELVGRYLARKADLSVAGLLKRLKEQQLGAKALCQTDADMTAKLGVAAAFQLSWEALSTDAQQLGCGLSLFAAAPISWSLVEQCFAEQDPEDLEEWRDSELLNLHLLQRVADFTYRLHPLIREFPRTKQNSLATADEQKYNYCTAMVEVASKTPDTPTLQEITTLIPVVPHLTEAATNYTSFLNNEDLIWPFIGLGRFYAGQGAYAQALPQYKQCLSVARERLGEEHPAVATSYNNLALLYYFQGRYTEAEPLCQKALSLRQRLLGEEHPAVATSYNNLALLYYFQGRYTEAEPLCQKALSLRQRLLGEEHPDVATSYNNLAGLYYFQGRYAEAEPLYQKALSLRQRLLGEEHPAVAQSYNNLAALYDSQGRYAEAEPLYQKALSLRQRLLGEEHPAVAQSYNNLAALYKSQGRYTEAEPLCQKALSLRQRLLGEEHPAVAQSYNNLANLYDSQGRYTEAEPLYQKALSLQQHLLGEEHPAVAQSYNNLANLYYFQGRYTEAEPLYQKALSLRQRLLGEEHPDVAQSYNNLAGLYKSQGRYTEAEPLHQKALETAELSLGVNHPNTITIRENLKILRDNQA